MPPLGILVLFIVMVIVLFTVFRYNKTEGFADSNDAYNTFINIQEKYFQNKAGKDIIINPGIPLTNLNGAIVQPDMELPTAVPDYTVYFTENPIPELMEHDMKFCNGAKMPVDLPRRNESDVVGCGWYFKPDSATPSFGVLGTRNGPIVSRSDITGGQWLWNLQTAQKEEEIKKCKRIRNCALLNIEGIQGQCGFCKDRGYAIPITSNGSAKYPTDDNVSCGSDLILSASDCYVPPPIVTEDGVNCGTMGRPSDDNSVRLYNQEECNKLGGNLHANGVCSKPGGNGSFSYDCRELNIPISSRGSDSNTPISTNINPCAPDENGRLPQLCLITIAKAMGLSNSGAIYKMLASRTPPSDTDRMAIEAITGIGIDIPAGTYDSSGQTTVETAGKTYGRIYSLMRDGPSKIVKEAAAWLAVGGVEFDICKINPDDKGPFAIECMQRAFKSAGCQPGGTRYPEKGNHKLSAWDYANMTWSQLNKAYTDLYGFMNSENVGTQNSAMQQCLGKGSEYFREDTSNRCWKCVPGILTPVSKNDNGDIECASSNGRDCLWQSTPEKCEALVKNMPANIKTVSCGEHHKRLYGTTGYDNPVHWCAKARTSAEFAKDTGEFDYKGCFKDKYDPKNPSLRAIPTMKGHVKSIGECKTIATANGANTFGVQYGGECWIGNNPHYDKYGKTTTCATLGGPESQHVYKREDKLPGGYEYKGCFKDSGNRAIPSYVGKVSSVDQCRAIALAKGGNTFGVQYGGECRIGHNAPYDKYGKAEGCGPLGNSWMQQVYKVEDKYEFKGCYKDDPRNGNTRAIPQKVAQVKSIEECKKKASDLGVNTFGVQYGGECWVGNDSPYDKYGKADNCGPLGGSAANLVFQTQQPYIDMGCYKDNSTRAIPYLIADKNVTVERCKELALERDADTLGLQANYQCFIGDNVKYDKFGKVPSCGEKGGNWINRVHKKAPRYDYKGCFKDKPERAIPTLAKNTRNFDECKQEAIKRGMNTFGIQAGNECWVGNDVAYDKYGTTTNCGPYSGGGWANKVYKTSAKLN